MTSRKKLIISFFAIVLIILLFRDGTLFRQNGAVAKLNTTSVMGTDIATTTDNANLSLITEPEQGIAPIVNAILGAKTSVDLVMYQLEDLQIEQALSADEARGVSVRVLLNGGYYGTPDVPNVNAAAYAFLTAHNVPVKWTPGRFALTHEKSLVIDAATPNAAAYIMTFNMTPQYYASSRDFAVIDTDANDVTAMTETFDADWNNQNVTASTGDDLIWSPNSETALVSFISGAQKSLLIYNEEMNDDTIVNALVSAAKRGVNVEVVMTDAAEWHANFAKLSTAGVVIKTYSSKATLYIHAKMIIADNDEVFVGSENFSPTSLDKNRELGIVTSDGAIISLLTQTFQKDFSNATQE